MECMVQINTRRRPVHRSHDRESIERVLTHHTWAIVGLGDDCGRAAFGAAAFLQQWGKRIVPVNPLGETVHGEPGYRSLADIPFPVDVVEVFEPTGNLVEQTLKAAVKAVWFEQDPGDVSELQRAGLDVVVDRCAAIELQRKCMTHPR
jgi:predicted CoA-binding protein